MLDHQLIFVSFIILVALVFDFTNGAHDAANSVATIVSTKVLTLGQALLFATFFNFIAFAVLGTAVAKTVGNGLVDVSTVTPSVILAGFLGAISGVGAVQRVSAVKWDVTLRIVWAWIFTIPAAAIFSGAIFLVGGFLAR